MRAPGYRVGQPCHVTRMLWPVVPCNLILLQHRTMYMYQDGADVEHSGRLQPPSHLLVLNQWLPRPELRADRAERAVANAVKAVKTPDNWLGHAGRKSETSRRVSRDSASIQVTDAAGSRLHLGQTWCWSRPTPTQQPSVGKEGGCLPFRWGGTLLLAAPSYHRQPSPRFQAAG